LLRGSQNLVAVWEALDLAGSVVRWIPEWEGVRNRPQRNPFHHFTVDRHSVETVVVAGPLLGDASNPDLVLLAALLHDIGKREGASDHSVTGAGLIPAIGARLGLPKKGIEDLRILVRHHLLLASLATTNDPASPETAKTLLASLRHRADLFEDLRVLTIADAMAAGPRAWNPWREKLFASLTNTARTVLAASPGTSSR
jgi:[protein-PII] uridylyltransferase